MSMLSTLCTGLTRARVTNSTDASFPTRIPQIGEPSGIGDAVAQTTSGVFDLVSTDNGITTQLNRAMIVPFGTGSDTNTFLMRVLGWYRIKTRTTGFNPNTDLWVPVPLAQITCTLSLQVGIAGMVNIETERFCDTLAIGTTTANQGVSIDVVSGANDLTAHLIIDLKGAQKMELTFDRNSSATACNALVGFY
jgi:hypothetical protein